METYVLVITRRGVIVGVFADSDVTRLKRKAEQLDGGALMWNNYLSHEGTMSRFDGERSYTLHRAQAVA